MRQQRRDYLARTQPPASVALCRTRVIAGRVARCATPTGGAICSFAVPTTSQIATAEESDEGGSLLQTVDAITSRVTAQAQQCQPMQQVVAADKLADVSSPLGEASAKPAIPNTPHASADASAGATEQSEPAQNGADGGQGPAMNGKSLLLADTKGLDSAEGNRTVRTSHHINARPSGCSKPATSVPRAQSGHHLARSAQHHLWGSLEMEEWLARGRPSPRRHIRRPLQREASCSASPRSVDRCSSCSHGHLWHTDITQGRPLSRDTGRDAKQRHPCQ